MNRRDLDRRIDAFFSETMDRADLTLLVIMSIAYIQVIATQRRHFSVNFSLMLPHTILYYAISANCEWRGNIIFQTQRHLLRTSASASYIQLFSLCASGIGVFQLYSEQALNKIYKHTLPKAHENDLDLLISTPTLFTG